jgi:DNA-binding response OmpR family regulator
MPQTANVVPIDVSEAPRRRRRSVHGAGDGQRSISARLITTARSSERLLQSAGEGTEDFILSSVDGRVSVRVRLAIGDVEAAAQRLADSSVTVDWSRATVSHARNRVTLSRTELRLFSGLVEASGEPVPRAALIARAWPRDRLPGPERENALGVYVFSLRKRLAAIGLGDVLRTVRGVGYRLVL